ncbi:MAG: hypothetical protein AAFR96_04080 [Planctomycetota bacterium]
MTASCRLCFSLVALSAAAQPVSAQLLVSDFSLGGAYFANAFLGSDSGDFNISEDPDGYTAIIPEATLVDEAGARAATFNGGFEGELLDAEGRGGFRVFGSVFGSEQAEPFFYDARYAVSNEVTFEITRPTKVLVTGRFEHDPIIGSGAISAINGTEFSLSGSGIDPEVFVTARVGPIEGLPRTVDLSETVMLVPGFYRIDIDSVSSGFGTSSPGLRSINAGWDLVVIAVPAPGAAWLGSIGLLALRRRR